MFKNDFYVVDDDGEMYLVDRKGVVLGNKARTKLKSVCGVGVNDWKYAVGSGRGGMPTAYDYWNSMLKRVYCEKYREHKPTYADVSVSKEWLSFTNFFNDTKTYMKKRWQLDKDLLIFDNKEYSKDSCIFVPSWLNSLLTDSANARGDLPQGVHWDNLVGAYKTQCNVDGVKKHVGRFSSVEAASAAYIGFKLNYIESKREEVEAVALHNNLHLRFGSDFSLTNRVIDNFKKQVFLLN